MGFKKLSEQELAPTINSADELIAVISGQLRKINVETLVTLLNENSARTRKILDVTNGVDFDSLENGVYDIKNSFGLFDDIIPLNSGDILIKDGCALTIICKYGSYYIEDYNADEDTIRNSYCTTKNDVDKAIDDAIENVAPPDGSMKTKIIHNENELESILTEITENFVESTPVFLIDFTGLMSEDGEATGLYIYDSGSGSIDDAILIPQYFNSLPFTQEDKDAILSIQTSQTGLKPLESSNWNPENPGSYVAATYKKVIKEPQNVKIHFKFKGTSVDPVINGVSGNFHTLGSDTAFTTDKNTIYEACLDIERGNNFWLCQLMYDDGNGTKFAFSEIPGTNTTNISPLSIRIGQSGGTISSIEIKNAYAKGG